MIVPKTGTVRSRKRRYFGKPKKTTSRLSPGIVNPGNLFVPFFTTKPGGSGIGLTLSRQIAEARNGSLTLANRTDRTGSEALLRLPR